MMATHHRGLCGLMCGELATTAVCGIPLCDPCIARIRAIAADAGVPVDEEMLTGQLKTLRRGTLTRAERKLADAQERREIEAIKQRRRTA